MSTIGDVRAVNVAVIQHNDGTVTFAERPLTTWVLPFNVNSLGENFIGRQDIFMAIDSFAQQHPRGYIEVTAEAGLGKTALAAELARRRQAIAFFASAMTGTRHPGQFLRHACAELVLRYDLDHATLPADLDNNAILVQLLGESAQRRGPVWVIVDALDEADPPQAGANPLLLPSELPDGVYVVATSRGSALFTLPGMPRLPIRLRRDSADQIGDVETYLRDRVANDARLSNAIASAVPPTSVDQFVGMVCEASEGNFRYVLYVLADVAESPPGMAFDGVSFPKGLTKYYEMFLASFMPAPDGDWDAWENLYEPMLKFLAVAREPVTAAWLARQAGRSTAQIEARILRPWTRLLDRDEVSGTVRWRLNHRSFADYIDSEFGLAATHAAVAQLYLDENDIERWDEYGLRHAGPHLEQAARMSSGVMRHDLMTRLGELVIDERLIDAQVQRLGDATLAGQQLDLAHNLLAEDNSPEAGPLLVEVALTSLRLRRGLVQPRMVFEAAETGNLSRAQRLLELLTVDLEHEWADLISLTAAWQAQSAAPEAAEAARERFLQRVGQPDKPALRLLLRRMLGEPPESPLPRPPALGEAADILDRLSGSAAMSLQGELRDAEGGYLSQIDGPLLVSAAASFPGIGDDLVDRYIAYHAAYGYPHYRLASLWYLLDAVLKHPDPIWARQRIVAIITAALAPVRGEFVDAVDIAAVASEAIAGKREARLEVQERATAAVEAARQLPRMALDGQGDAWAVHRRRLAAHIEAASRLNADPGLIESLAAVAIHVPGGFAGFSAPALLTVAEALSIARPQHDLIHYALTEARRAAHNIQDQVFCARTTARVNAMSELWWPGPSNGDIMAAADRLAREPGAEDFCALHVVGEPYAMRIAGLLPTVMMAAATLSDIATVFQRSLDELKRVNHQAGWEVDQPLPAGTWVRIPDPGFPPLIAARLAAAALAAAQQNHSSWEEAAATIRRLAPAAGADATALSSTLARLLLATPRNDLGRIRQLVRRTSLSGSTAG